MVSSVASNSRTVTVLPPKSVASVLESSISISHARCFLLGFFSISSPSIVCFIELPSGLIKDSSTSLRIACNLSPGITSTSEDKRRFGVSDTETEGVLNDSRASDRLFRLICSSLTIVSSISQISESLLLD